MRKWIDLIIESNEDDIDQWKAPRGLQTPRAEDWAMFAKVRDSCRAANGGGGLCHEVSEWIEHVYDWERVAGSYLAPSGEVCIAGHYWNLLPDGSILDCTADQTGEGHDMVIITPDDPSYGRYDDEHQEEWNPSEAGYEGRMNSPLRLPYQGEEDYDQQDRLEGERGKHWWATHPEQFRAYVEQQIAHAKAKGDPFGDSEKFQHWLNAVEARHA